jgi:lipopolysaccharide export LptBFGC system permease protein LptF
MSQFLRIAGLAVAKGVSLFWVAGCFVRLLPSLLSLCIPMAFVVSLMLAFGELADGGEVLALRAAGFSFFEISRPFLAAAALLSCLLFYLNHKAGPEGYHSFRNRTALAAQQISKLDVEPGQFIQIGPWRLYAREADAQNGRLGGIYFVRAEGGGIRIDAEKGTLSLKNGGGMRLSLENGNIRVLGAEPSRFISGSFRSYEIEAETAGMIGARPLEMQEMNSGHLKEAMRESQTEAQHKVEYAVELAVRSAGALSPLIFFLAAAPLGLSLDRNSRAMGFLLSLAVLFSYYGLTTLGIGIGRRHSEMASLAPWAADVFGVIVGAVLIRRAVRR